MSAEPPVGTDDNPVEPEVRDLLDRLIKGPEETRGACLLAFQELDRRRKAIAFNEIRYELRTRFSPHFDYTAPVPGAIATVRGWLLSAMRVVGADVPPPQLFGQLSEHALIDKEPSEWVRYWALANMNWVSNEAAAAFCEGLSDDSSLVSALRLAIIGRYEPERLAALIELLTGWQENPRMAWAALRALEVVPIRAALQPTGRMLDEMLDAGILDDERNALTYDALMVFVHADSNDVLASFEPSRLARLAIMSMRGARPDQVRRVLSLVGRTRPAALPLLGAALKDERRIGSEALELVNAVSAQGSSSAIPLPSGVSRAELAYYLVLRNPARYDMLVSFNPAELRAMAASVAPTPPANEAAMQTLLTTLRGEAAHPPPALWLAWVETAEPAKLTQE